MTDWSVIYKGELDWSGGGICGRKINELPEAFSCDLAALATVAAAGKLYGSHGLSFPPRRLAQH